MFKIEINGKEYSGFRDASISLDIESIANSFSCTLTNFYQEQVSDIRAGDDVKIYDAGTLIITGYIDSANPSIDASEGNTITISGRSQAADLVDCSLDTESNEFKKQTMEGLFSLAIAGFKDLSVSANVDTGATIETAIYDHGQRVYEFLRKHLEAKELIAYSKPDGSIIIDRAGTEQGSLEFIEGQNIINGSSTIDFSERFSKYIAKGDFQSDTFVSEEDATDPESIVTDDGVKRARPLIIIVDGEADKAKCERRAKWEAAIRKGKSVVYSVTTNQWSFEINKLARLNASSLGFVGGVLLVSAIELSFDEQGRRATYTLVDPDSYRQQPDKDLKEDKESENIWGNTQDA